MTCVYRKKQSAARVSAHVTRMFKLVHVCQSVSLSMCGYFCVCVSLLRGEYRDHTAPERVNIPSQVFLISLERRRKREIRRKINIKTRKEKKKRKQRKEVPRKCE